jgi:hypothetical protein
VPIGARGGEDVAQARPVQPDDGLDRRGTEGPVPFPGEGRQDRVDRRWIAQRRSGGGPDERVFVTEEGHDGGRIAPGAEHLARAAADEGIGMAKAQLREARFDGGRRGAQGCRGPEADAGVGIPQERQQGVEGARIVEGTEGLDGLDAVGRVFLDGVQERHERDHGLPPFSVSAR